MIAATLTIPAVDTGYSLSQLLVTALGAGPAGNLPIRYTEVILQWESNQVFVVPSTGALATTTGTTPDQYGARLDTTTRTVILRAGYNTLSPDEIILAADTASTPVHLLAYTT